MKKLFLLMAFISSASYANDISVSKLRLQMVGGQQSDFLLIKNDGNKDKQSFEVNVQKWTQHSNIDKSGKEVNNNPEMILADTDEVITFPKTLVIAPKQEKIIRVITKNPNAALQYSYRMNINQLPAEGIVQEKNTVQFLFNMSIPVFVSNDKMKTIDKMKIDYKIVNNQKEKYVLITNNDSQHIQVSKIISDLPPASLNFYILPQMTQKIMLPLNSTQYRLATDKGTLELKQ